MKKVSLILSLLAVVSLVSCGEVTTSSSSKESLTSSIVVPTSPMSIVAPSGAPALGLVHYFSSYKEQSAIVAADSLVPTFVKGEKDAIVAPINVGIKMYNTNANYKLFKTITWGNLFILAKAEEKVTNILDLKGKTVVAFGKGSVPEIVLSSILAKNNITDCTVNYSAKDVTEAVAQFKGGTANIIIVAEPILSKIKKSLGTGINIISLQEEYKKINGDASYPQAALFVNKNYIEKFSDKYMLEMLSSITKVNSELETSAEVAVALDNSFATIGKEALISAIPNCSINYLNDKKAEKSAVEKYLTYIDDLKLSASYGAKVPDEAFYI
ncbi:MAG: ABC transporter substrate-binding protein [Bacilli bacterium]